MLKGISPVISPELLKTLAEMGHGDEIVIADAHFPAKTCNPSAIRADGIPAAALVAGIGALIDLDRYAVLSGIMDYGEESAVDVAEHSSAVKTAAVPAPRRIRAGGRRR